MIIGIDLGTTNSLAACFRNGQVEIIPNRLGKKLTPSVVSIDDDGQILVGETAREYGYLHPDRSARLFKRTMGTDQMYVLAGQNFTSIELSAMVLRALKEDAEVYLKQKIDEAIISVPAYFNDHQRKATRDAGQLAGLKVSRIINEPTASAIAYGIGDEGISECCMVLDLGGGTFDVTVLDYFHNIMEVYAIAGDNRLGGEDFTIALTALFMEKCGVTVDETDLKTVSDIYKAAEISKCSLGSNKEMSMKVTVNGHLYQQVITADEYEAACLFLLERMRRPIEKSLHDAEITLSDLDRIILVGGATRMKMIHRYIQRMTGLFPEYTVDPDLSVAEGAALVSAMKERNRDIEEVILTDVCPFTLGTEVTSGTGGIEDELHYLPIIERNTVIPVSRTQTVYTAHDDQDIVTVKILQGESRLPGANLLIGKISIDVPPAPRGEQAVEITYTYDVNSLLEVKVKSVSTGIEKSVVIQNEQSQLDETEVQKRLERLQYLKQNPREDEENIYAQLRAERVLTETDDDGAERIQEAMEAFEKALDSSTHLEITVRRQQLLKILDEIEDSETTGFAA